MKLNKKREEKTVKSFFLICLIVRLLLFKSIFFLLWEMEAKNVCGFCTNATDAVDKDQIKYTEIFLKKMIQKYSNHII